MYGVDIESKERLISEKVSRMILFGCTIALIHSKSLSTSTSFIPQPPEIFQS